MLCQKRLDLLTCNSIIKGLLGKMAGLVGGVENFIVEHREVQGKSKTDGVSRGKVGGCNFSSRFVGFQRLIGRILALVANGELSKVAMIVAFPAVDISKLFLDIRANGVQRTSCGRRP